MLEAGEELLAQQGLPGFSMRKLGRLVGLSEAAIYRHFSNKDELVQTIIQRGYDRLLKTLEEILTDSSRSCIQKTVAAISAYINFALEQPDLFKVVVMQDAGPGKSQVNGLKRGISQSRKTFTLFVAVLSEGMKKGEFAPAPPEITAMTIWACLYGLASRLIIESPLDPELQNQIIQRFSQVILGGLIHGTSFTSL
ncbi:TetR/AcrR family transcriptional regulator [Gracilinema caldarium]|uniref:Transcriptional regulator, TetR family n=1 Tax=Gracilinema caldarium (strain ATCC 51460 / DSM 7334 / H1) TaxID=744872 RepID=F8F481_GRAC1|nr:TetR/AcrR family transcriptional regulator [Gracilinema caldarium]AEJ20528.1 transcriptional regulator, TetR family [Gracilinema caldarium DSM 7334]